MIEAVKAIGVTQRLGKMFVLTDRRDQPARNLYLTTSGAEEYDDGVLFRYPPE